jgi:hypothetical protein
MNNRFKEFEELLLENVLFKDIIKPWKIKTLSGSSGGKSFKSSRNNRFKKSWN